jgi:hypothetical protein
MAWLTATKNWSHRSRGVSSSSSCQALAIVSRKLLGNVLRTTFQPSSFSNRWAGNTVFSK